MIIDDTPVPEESLYNEQVVKLLEKWVDHAKKGRITLCAVLGTEGGLNVMAEYKGNVEHTMALNYAVDMMKNHLVHGFKAGTQRGNLDASYVRYDVSSASLSYDFTAWLVAAHMRMVRENAAPPLKVCFCNQRYDNDRISESFIENVLRPMLPLIGAVEDSRAIDGATNQFFAYRPVTEAALEGEPVPKFRASMRGRYLTQEFKGYVTITLREAGHWPHRNSNLPEWIKFADYLTKRGEKVVFVRDTAKVGEPLSHYKTCDYASLLLDARMGLYEQAKCNLFVSNGPWCLALHSDVPWLGFNKVSADDTYGPNKPDWWVTSHGINEGEQFPWQRSDQRIIWELDTFENMKKAWDDLWSLDQNRHVRVVSTA